MAVSVAFRGKRRIEFGGRELAGALGDSVTVFPIVVALGALTPISVPHVLLWFGAFQIVWGLAYGLPLSVEPMKALAGLAVAGVVSYAELAAAGLLVGVVLLFAGRTGAVSRIAGVVREPTVRGVQLAVALLLAQAGLSLGLADPALALGAVAAVGAVAALGYRRAGTLVVLGGGTALAIAEVGVPTPAIPAPTLLPTAPRLTSGTVEAAAGQLAMTIGNASVATALLCADLFDAEVSADDLASSMGGMCLVAVPFGGLPMCHGSGGLAGKYAFGARTGGANVLLGVLYLAAACVAGLVVAFPTAVLGVLLVGVALQLVRSAARTDRRALTVGIGLVGVLANVGVAFVLGVVADLLVRRIETRRE